VGRGGERGVGFAVLCRGLSSHADGYCQTSSSTRVKYLNHCQTLHPFQWRDPDQSQALLYLRLSSQRYHGPSAGRRDRGTAKETRTRNCKVSASSRRAVYIHLQQTCGCTTLCANRAMKFAAVEIDGDDVLRHCRLFGVKCTFCGATTSSPGPPASAH